MIIKTKNEFHITARKIVTPDFMMIAKRLKILMGNWITRNLSLFKML